MTCSLCKIWEMMPYHKRWSTPMSAAEGEGAMAAGWWVAMMAIGQTDPDFSTQLCDRHSAIMQTFNEQHAKRKQIESEMRVQVAPGHEKTVEEFLARARSLHAPIPPPEPAKPAMVVPGFAASVPKAPEPSPPPPPKMQHTAPVAAMQPAPKPAVTTFPCPLCGKPTFNGDVHSCGGNDDEKA